MVFVELETALAPGVTRAMEFGGMLELASFMQVTKVKFVLRINALKTATTMVFVVISLVSVTRDTGVSPCWLSLELEYLSLVVIEFSAGDIMVFDGGRL